MAQTPLDFGLPLTAPVTLALQRKAGNRAVARRLAMRAPAVIQRDDTAEESPVKKALRTKDPADVKAITDFKGVDTNTKMELVRILAYQGWVGPLDESKIEEIWNTLPEAEFIKTASLEIVMFNHCIEVGAELDKLPHARGLKGSFYRDILDVVRDYLWKNKRVVEQEMEAAGIPRFEHQAPEPQTEQQEAHMRAMQTAAAIIADLQVQQERARTIAVGYEEKLHGDTGYKAFPVKFNPYAPPPMDEAARKAKGRAVPIGYEEKITPYEEVKRPYDKTVESIRALLNAYPMVYAISREGKSDATGAFAVAKDPAAARAQLAGALRKLIQDIDATEKKLGKELDPLDLQPIHTQLFKGKQGSSKVDWGQALPQFIAKQEIGDHEFGKALNVLGLDVIGQAAFLLAPFTGGASLAVLLAVGVGAAGAKAYMAQEQFEVLAQASKTAVTKGSELVTPEQVNEAEVMADAAKAEAAMAALNAVAIGAGAVSRWSAARAAARGKPPPTAAKTLSQALEFIDDVQTFESLIDSLPDAASYVEKAAISYGLFQSTPPAGGGNVGRLVQRAPNYGKDFEAYVESGLYSGSLSSDIPKMDFVMPGAHNHLDNGIDRIGVRFVNGQVEVYHFEMKWRNPAELSQPAPEVKLGKPSVGTQVGGAWTGHAVNSLCSDTKEAMMARDSLRAQIARHKGVPIGHVSDNEVKRVLRAHLNPKTVVVVPSHVSLKTLYKQIAALIRHGRNVRVVKVKVP